MRISMFSNSVKVGVGFLALLPIVNGHGYMHSPRSLNWAAHEDGLDWGWTKGKPKKEYCYHCLNVKAKHETCGNSGNMNYDNFVDSFGDPMPWHSEETFVEGQIITVKSYLSAHHYGHMEVRACPHVDNLTPNCFDEWLLEFEEDPMYNAPKNKLYPHYAHYADKDKRDYTHKLKLPMGLAGEKVMLQYKYITANSCNPLGYLEYNWPDPSWWAGPNLGTCTAYPEDGARLPKTPEQFWNCAQVTINSSGPTTEPTPKGPTTEPTPKGPTSEPTSSPPTSKKIATTTRYWDCSGGACGCAYLPAHLNGNNNEPAHCYSNALFQAPTGNEYGAKFYGTAAVSNTLGGDDWLGDSCGKCWKVTGTGNVPGRSDTTTLVLRAANYCPPEALGCEIGNAHFDIAAPGFDVLQYSLSNDCNKLEPKENAGFESCGYWRISSDDPNDFCECDLFTDPILRAGCENFLSLGWDNPLVAYEEVICPDEMVTPCWEDNGNGYPPFTSTPDTCLSPSPVDSSPTPSPSESTGNRVASTSRYWDCTGGACGCAYLPAQFFGDESRPSHCYSNALFQAPTGNEYEAKFYGTAAVSKTLGGGNWLGDSCGQCWKVTGTGNVPGRTETSTIILKGIDYCPDSGTGNCGNNKAHFTIASPGFDLSDTCREREIIERAGFESCGYWGASSDENCDCDRFINPVLRAGCKNFLSLGWDDPDVTYEEVVCPTEMVTPCWEENGNGYPPFTSTPDTCLSPSSNPVTLSPTQTPKACRSSNYKDCDNTELVKSRPTLFTNEIILEKGAKKNCIALFGDCINKENKDNSCCESLFCDGNSKFSQCVPCLDDRKFKSGKKKCKAMKKKKDKFCKRPEVKLGCPKMCGRC